MSGRMLDGTRLFFKKVKREVRTYLLEFGMVTMVGLLVFGMYMSRCLTTEFAIRNAKMNGTQHVLFYGDVQKPNMTEVEQCNVKSFHRFVEKYGFLGNGKGNTTVTVTWYEATSEIPYDIKVTGRMPKDEREILLPETAWKEGMKLGDSLVFSTDEGEEIELVIVGTYSMDYDFSSTAKSKVFSYIQKLESCNGAVVTFQNLRKVPEKSKRLTTIVNAEGYMVNESLLSAYGYDENSSFTTWLSKLMVVFFILILYGMIKGSIAMRSLEIYREYAVWRSLGMKKKKLIGFALSEGMWLGSFGGITGGLLGFLVMIFAMRYSGLNWDDAFKTLRTGFVSSMIIGTAVTFLITCIAKLSMLRKPFRLQICELFQNQSQKVQRHKREKNYKNPVWAYIVTSLSRNKGRVILSILLFAGGILFFVCSATIRKDLLESYGDRAKLHQYYNVSVHLQEGYSEYTSTDKLISAVSQIPYVEAVCDNPLQKQMIYNVDDTFGPGEYQTGYAVKNGKYERINICVYTEEEITAIKPVLIEGDLDILEGGCLLVNYSYPVDSYGRVDSSQKVPISNKKTGDNIRIPDFSETNKESDAAEQMINLEIKGVVTADLHFGDEYYPVLILSEHYARTLLKDNVRESGSLYVRLADDCKLSDFQKECNRISGVLQARYFNFAYELDQEMSSIFGILNGLVFIAVLTGMINIVCTVMMNWEATRREYAILKAVGATKSRIIRLVAIEKMMVCMASGVLGTSGGVLIGKCIMKIVLNGKKNSMEIPTREVILSLAAMVLCTVLATLFQSSLLKKMNISEVLKAEE